MKEVEARVRFGTLRWLSQEEKQKQKEEKNLHSSKLFFFGRYLNNVL